MPDSARQPVLTDLYRLGKQLESDADTSPVSLRERDHRIGMACDSRDSAGRLLFWLDRLEAGSTAGEQRWLTEQTAALLMRVVAAVAGFLTMLGFMFASDRALVNVFLFMVLFVVLQLIFSLVAAVVMLRSLRGSPPAAFSLNPAQFVAARALPDARFLRECAGVLRLLVLRYGQEFGAVFTLGAMIAFFCLLAFTDFSFVWGSTFGVSDELVTVLANITSAPWSAWLPQAVVSPEVITDTRYHPSQLDLGQINDDSRRGWWPFLLMSMAVYALLPRLLLWLASRFAFAREINRAFIGFPGAAAVLSRMRSPVVSTRALEPDSPEAESPPVAIDETLMVLNWAGALDDTHSRRFEALLPVPAANLVNAGLGTVEEDEAGIARINAYKPESLLVAVKAWEPPLADLADTLAGVTGIPRCELCLVPLPGRDVSEHSVEEWQAFSRRLSFPVVQVQTLYWM